MTYEVCSEPFNDKKDNQEDYIIFNLNEKISIPNGFEKVQVGELVKYDFLFPVEGNWIKAGQIGIEVKSQMYIRPKKYLIQKVSIDGKLVEIPEGYEVIEFGAFIEDGDLWYGLKGWAKSERIGEQSNKTATYCRPIKKSNRIFSDGKSIEIPIGYRIIKDSECLMADDLWYWESNKESVRKGWLKTTLLGSYPVKGRVYIRPTGIYRLPNNLMLETGSKISYPDNKQSSSSYSNTTYTAAKKPSFIFSS
jgi:hypothetical protein